MLRMLRMLNILPNISDFIIIFSNVVSFMTVQTCFFWFIACMNVEYIIDDKSILIIELINVLNANSLIRNYSKTNEYIELGIRARDSSMLRQIHNTNELVVWVIPSFVFVSLLLFISIFVCYYFKKKFDKIDFLVLLLVISLSFFTELIFYFAVISRLEHISDYDIIELLLENTIFDYLILD
jgi:hypothetical protein